MLIPYRVKNPWKRFPYATVALIALNMVIYGMTTQDGLVIRDAVADRFAFHLGISPVITLFTAMFLHADPFHLLGNMLFLWVFAPPVEDRLGIPRFLAIYLITGIVGDLMQAGVDVLFYGQTVAIIGASGCIMGIMGAYWYLFSWSTVCVFYFIMIIRIYAGTWEVAAFWIIGLFVLLDIGRGLLGGGGVANFAHVGGSLAGALLCLALGMKRDTAALSEVKRAQAEVEHLELLTLQELELIRADDPQNLRVLRALVHPALAQGESDLLHRAFRDAGPSLIDSDPQLVMEYLQLQGDVTIYSARDLLRLARIAEDGANPTVALHLYALVRSTYPRAIESEMALYRMGVVSWEKLHDRATAIRHLHALLEQYPFSTMEPYVRVLLRELEAEG
jgi:membrane associated rhomboid family serine protease